MTIADLGWAVVHSTWQWTLIAGATVLAASLLPDRKASLRYAVAAAGVMAMLAAFAVTLVTAETMARAGLRYRLLYAFEGAVVMPPIAPRGFMILRIAAVVWLAGVTLGAIRLGRAWLRVRRLRRSAVHAVDPPTASAFASLCDQLRVRRPVALGCSAQAQVPMLLGWRRPLVLLPLSASASLTADQIRAVLAHELGHVRRRDDVATAVQAIAELFLFHHPGARWLTKRLRTEREYSCDDIAIAATGHPRVYARALAAIEDARCDCGLAVAAASGTLLDRIQRVLDQPRRVLSARRGLAAFAAAVVAATALLAAAINVPPPSAPAGIRMRRPMPPPAADAAARPRTPAPPGVPR
jgi:beta-lactamase regulating signal transducer with metallopeptidase domain